jgi:hypothetical protein
MQWSLLFFYIFALSFAGMSLAFRLPIRVDLPFFLFLSRRSDFPFHYFWILRIFSQYSSFLARSSRLSIFTNSSWMALEYSLLMDVWSPALDTQGCATPGFTPTCSCQAYRNCAAPKFCPNSSWEPNCSSRAWNLHGRSLQDFQAIPLRSVRITCNQMTTLHSILSGLPVLFVFMYVCTLSKSNKIFSFDESYALTTWILN